MQAGNSEPTTASATAAQDSEVRASPFDGHAILASTRQFLQQTHELLIGGDWTAAEAGGSIDSADPATGLQLATVAAGQASDIDRAVRAARGAFNGPWPRVAPRERAAFLSRLARLIEARREVFTELEILDNGMPRGIAALTVDNCVEMLDYYAGWATKIEGVTTTPPAHVTMQSEALTYTLREPVGVVGQIIPWNVPLSMAILKLAPALAAGCTVVLKPAEETPLSALLLAAMVLEADFPAGVVNIVNGRGETAGAALVEHADVDKIAFTGSTEVGRKIIVAAAGNLKKVSLELGGKSPVIVMPDADLDRTIPGIAMATFFLQGQNCMAGTRIYVHDLVHDQVVAGLVRFAQGMRIGHGLDPATQVGPLISQTQVERVLAFIECGRREGATLAAGGARVPRPGHFLQPTIFTDTRPQMRIVREEIFGPVMAIQRFNTEDLDEVARLANDTVYGLSGSVWTHSLSTAHRLVCRIRAGHVSINCHGAVGTNIPFGGYKQSGWGREFGRDGIEAYLETKAVTAQL
jgi:phenylacetaldehyde dehydrogenase